jgi:hypothetical protein
VCAAQRTTRNFRHSRRRWLRYSITLPLDYFENCLDFRHLSETASSFQFHGSLKSLFLVRGQFAPSFGRALRIKSACTHPLGRNESLEAQQPNKVITHFSRGTCPFIRIPASIAGRRQTYQEWALNRSWMPTRAPASRKAKTSTRHCYNKKVDVLA